MVSGSILTWHIAIPIYQAFFMNTDPALAASVAAASSTEAAFAIWGEDAPCRRDADRWHLDPDLAAQVAAQRRQERLCRRPQDGGPVHTERDLPMKWMLVALVAFVLPLLALYQAIVGQWHVSIPMTLIMIVAGFLFVSVSAYLAGLIGSSNNPVSGITISTILFASAVLVVLLGADGLKPVGRRGAAGRGGRDHDRCGGVLCRCGRW